MKASQVRPTGYWAGVLGTAMFFMGVFGLAYGWTTVSVGHELQEMADSLERNRFGMALGGVIRAASLGVLELAGVETGEAAKKLIAFMPSPGFLNFMGWARIILSGVAIVNGVLLALRFRWAVLVAAVWSVTSIAWFIFSTYMAWNLYTNSLGHPLKGSNSPLYLMDAVMHLMWPLFLGAWLITVLFRGKLRSWSGKAEIDSPSNRNQLQ